MISVRGVLDQCPARRAFVRHLAVADAGQRGQNSAYQSNVRRTPSSNETAGT